LAKARQAIEKKEFERATAYVDKIIEKYDAFAFPFELSGRINEMRGNWHHAYSDYLIALADTNEGNGKIIHGHQLEEKILDMAAGNVRKDKFFKKISSIKEQRSNGFSRNFIVAQYELFDKASLMGSARHSGRIREDERKETRGMLCFGVIPVMCGYLVRAIKNKPKIDSFETEVVNKLLKVVVEQKKNDFEKESDNDATLARAYYLAGEIAMRQENFSKAFDYFEKSISCDNNVSFLYAKMAFALVKNEQTLESVEKAIEILTDAAKRFGKDNLFENDKNRILKEKEKIRANQKKEEKLKETYYAASVLFENVKYKECLDLLSGIKRQALGMEFYADLIKLTKKAYSVIKLKQRALICFRQKSYEEAGQLFTRILEKNPYDAEIIGLAVDLFIVLGHKKREKSRLKKLRTYMKEAEGLCIFAVKQIELGHIKRAKNKYHDALKMLSEVSSEKEVQELILEIQNKLAEIKDLPDVLERKREAKPEKTAKKKNGRDVFPEKNGENIKSSSKNIKVPVFRGQEPKIRLSGQVADMLRRIDRKDRDMLLKEIKLTAGGKTKHVKKIETSDDIYRISKNDYRVIHMTLDGDTMLICEMETKKKTKYGAIVKRLSDPNTRRRLLIYSLSIEEFEESFLPKKSKQKSKNKMVTNLTKSNLQKENNNIVEKSLKSVWSAKRIEKNTKEIAPCLVQGLIDVAESVAEKNEKAILYFDEELTKRGGKELLNAKKDLLRVLIHIEDNNEELFLFLKDKLEIRSGSREEFIKKKGKVKPENIIVVTNETNFEDGYFSSIEGSGIITAINDTGFSEEAYFPLVGATLFAIGKYLKWDEKTLRKFYKKIPNAISITDLSNEEYANLFGKDSKSMIINLIPEATEFDVNEHVEIIECVRDILSKA